MMCTGSVNTDSLCETEQRRLSLTYLPLSHLCTSSPCPSPAGPGSCNWLTAALWSSSPGCSDPRRQICMSAVRRRSTPARMQTAPRTRTAGLCSPPEQSLLPGPGQLACPCRIGGFPSAQTTVSDRRSLSRPVGECCMSFLHNSLIETIWREVKCEIPNYQCNHGMGKFSNVQNFYILHGFD